MENKNTLNDIFSDFKSETSEFLFEPIKIININSYNNTTTSIIPQKGGFFSLTSSSNNEVNSNEVNKLINKERKNHGRQPEQVFWQDHREAVTGCASN